MSVAGYSGTPLARMPGVKEGMRVAWLGAPGDFDALVGELPGDVAALRAGWVGVKVCAIDATWSALRLVVPKAQRS